MANEYKAWYRGNDPQNAREGWDAYNRPFGERYERPPEYQEVRGDAYRHYAERYDVTVDQDKKRVEPDEDKSQDQAKQSQRARTARAGQTAVKSVVQSIAGTTVAAVVGAVVLVAGYQAIEAEKAASEPVPAIVQTVEWTWDEDYSSALVALWDEEGNEIAQVPAEVSVTTQDATCTSDGRKTYKATVKYDEKTYSDEKYETLPAIDHKYGVGIPITTNGVQTGILYECEHCHEQFIVNVGVEEE